MESEQKHILVVGHPLVVNANRKFWAVFAQVNGVQVDLVCPAKWRSNLIKELIYQQDGEIDDCFSQIYPLHCYFKGNGSLFFFSPWKMWKILQRKYDFIFVNQEGWSLAFTLIHLLLYFSTNRNSPLFITAAQNIKKTNWSWMHLFERWNAKVLSAIFYCSKGVREVLSWKKLPTKYYYLPLSFDEQVYGGYSQRDLRRLNGSKLGAETTLKVGYMGRISEDKGVLVLQDAISQLRRQGVNIELVLAGAGPLVEELQGEGVRYLGVFPHEKAYRFYGEVDLFVLPSLTFSHWKEQFGRVLVEAAAAGCIVAGSNSGSIPEVLSKLESPFVFQEGESDSLVNTVNQLLELASKERLETLARKSRENSFTLFSHCSVSKYLYKIWENHIL